MATVAPTRLPPLPTPPHDPMWHRLDARVGWRAVLLDQVAPDASGEALALAYLPGSGPSFLDPSGSLGGLVLPQNVAVDDEGNVYLLDVDGARLLRFDPCACAFEPLPCTGERGTGARQLVDPRAIAIHDGDLFVADAGDPAGGINGRVLVFSLAALALRGVWTLPVFWRPVAIAADRRGRIWVADAVNAALHRFDRRGRLEGSFAGFGGIVHVAVDCDCRVYAVLGGADETVVLDPDGGRIGSEASPAALRPRFPTLTLSFGPDWLDLRDRCVEPAACAPAASGYFDLAGKPIAPPAAAPPQLHTEGTWIAGPLDSRLYRCQWHRVVLCAEVPAESRLEVDTHTAEVPISQAQVVTLPESAWATRLAVVPDEAGEWDGLVRSEPGRYLWLRVRFRGSGTVSARVCSVRIEYPRIPLRRYLPAVWGEDAEAADFTDRFLSLFDTLFRSVEVQLDTQARLYDPLSAPAEPEADFLSWLASWIGISFDRQWPVRMRRQLLKGAGRLFRLRGTREGLWRQLLLLLGLEGAGERCRPAPPHPCCGQATPHRCTNEPAAPVWEPPPLILEHYQLRRWLFLGAGRLGDQARLWGEAIVNRSPLRGQGPLEAGAQIGTTQLLTTPDPLRDPFHVYAHRFSVFLPAACFRAPEQRRALRALIAAEKPAHTEEQILFVEPRFRIGIQSTIGLNSVVGRWPEGGVTLAGASGPADPADITRLGADTLLPGGTRGHGPAFRVGENARVGQTTSLE